jgi:hypothetical protein
MDYSKLKASLVLPMLGKYGKVVSLRRPATSAGWTKAFDGAEGRFQWTLNVPPFTVVYVDPATAPVDTAGHAIEKKYEQNEIDGTTVFATDRRFITADLPEPTSADKLVVGTKVLTIVNVAPMEPGEVTLLWVLQCRGP